MTSLAHEAFAARFAQSQNRVYAYVRTLISNPSDAEEIFQQTVLVLWTKWSEFDAERDFVVWACGIARNEARNFLRKHERRNEYLSDEVLDLISQATFESNDWLEARQKALADCVRKLSTHDGQLVDHAYHEGATIRSTAQALGITPNVLYKQLCKIRRVLMECVDRALAGEGSK